MPLTMGGHIRDSHIRDSHIRDIRDIRGRWP